MVGGSNPLVPTIKIQRVTEFSVALFLFKKPSVNRIGIFLSQTKSLIDYSKQKVLNNLNRRARKEVSNMTICPIALAVGCEKCPAFNFCPLTTVLGDQEKEEPVSKVWEESFPPEKNKDNDDKKAGF